MPYCIRNIFKYKKFFLFALLSMICWYYSQHYSISISIRPKHALESQSAAMTVYALLDFILTAIVFLGLLVTVVLGTFIKSKYIKRKFLNELLKYQFEIIRKMDKVLYDIILADISRNHVEPLTEDNKKYIKEIIRTDVTIQFLWASLLHQELRGIENLSLQQNIENNTKIRRIMSIVREKFQQHIQVAA